MFWPGGLYLVINNSDSGLTDIAYPESIKNNCAQTPLHCTKRLASTDADTNTMFTRSLPCTN